MNIIFDKSDIFINGGYSSYKISEEALEQLKQKVTGIKVFSSDEKTVRSILGKIVDIDKEGNVTVELNSNSINKLIIPVTHDLCFSLIAGVDGGEIYLIHSVTVVIVPINFSS